MSTVDPKIELMLQEARQVRGRAAAGGESIPDDIAAPEMIPVLLKFSGNIEDLAAVGFRPRTVLRNLATGVIASHDLQALVNHPNLVKLELSRPMPPELNVSGPSIGIDTVHNTAPSLKGSGVVVGIIDTGIDYRHDCFRKADGTSRILFLWDMRPPTGSPGTPPAGYTIGIEYSQAQLNAALATANPLGVVPHEDSDRDSGHGSHVAGIAAGNGRAEGNCHGAGTFVGMAPEADVIAVELASDTGELGESMNLIDAIAYIFTKAESAGKPAVINVSLGDNIGAHDGTSLVEQFIDLFVSVVDGRALVKSAGNEGRSNRHAAGTIAAAGASANVQFQVPANLADAIVIDLWYEGGDRFDTRVNPPTGAGAGPVTPGNLIASSPLANGNRVSINSQLNDIDNNDNRIQIEIRRGTQASIAAGTWTMALTATTHTNGTFHAWIERDTRTQFLAPFLSRDFTISVPGTARRAITVGAYADRGPTSGALGDFSSRGPTRDNVIKPEIVAPGDGIFSVLSSSISGQPACMEICADRYHPLPGTSMAAPHVTGVVALMLQTNPVLPIDDIRTHLFATTSKDPGSMGVLPNSNWGHGIVNAPNAISAVPTPPALVDPSLSAGEDAPDAVPAPEGASSGAGSSNDVDVSVLLDTPEGRLYADLARKHAGEVRNLINTNPRIGATWVRVGGPELVRALMRAARDLDAPIPIEVRSQPLDRTFDIMEAELARRGTAELRADLERHGWILRLLPGRSLRQAIGDLHAARDQAAD